MQAPAPNAVLEQWLKWLEQLHPTEIDLGLERVAAVASRANLATPKVPVITVGGTNGKGSVVETLMRSYQAAGYKVGAYTSPHLIKFNERIRINSGQVADDDIRDALQRLEQVREDTSLTYFEFTTLAAMHIFLQQSVDVIILEVGLGGRLDAVNIWDCECAVITSIGIDHESWLGSDREVIAAEKVAIARPGKSLVVGEVDPPSTIASIALEMGANIAQIGRDFTAGLSAGHNPQLELTVSGQATQLYSRPAMSGAHQLNNAAVAVIVLNSLQALLPISAVAINQALEGTQLPGRMQVTDYNGVPMMMDVAHNAAAASALSATIEQQWAGYRVHAIFSIMADKAIDSVIDALLPSVDHWYCAKLTVERALPAVELARRVNARIEASNVKNVKASCYDSVEQALQGVITRIQGDQTAPGLQNPGLQNSGLQNSGRRKSDLPEKNVIVVFGSFFTVTELLQ